MFGLLRLVLAVMVMVGHLFWISDFGRFAVFGFFILSGYLMTLIMHGTYHYTGGGVIKFIVNRLLRLYPSYWLACILSIMVIYLLGEQNTLEFNRYLALPSSFSEIAVNVTMISFSFFPNEVTPRLSPATWALTVELFYYVIIAFGISKTKTRTLIWIALSFVYVLLTYAADLYWHARYFAVPAGSLPFSIGALLYFLNRENWQPKWLNNNYLNSRTFLIALVVNAIIGSLLQLDENTILLAEGIFYLNILICSLLIYSIIRGDKILNISGSIDKKIGDYSYPVYLVHWQIGAIVSFIVFGQVDSMKFQISPISWILAGLLVVLCSYLMIKFIDKPIELIRGKIRGFSNMRERKNTRSISR